MNKPEIIGSARSTYTRVVRMVREENGIDHVLTEAALGAPELAAIHPFGKMPVLRHGAIELFESRAIASYLDRSTSVLTSDTHCSVSAARGGSERMKNGAGKTPDGSPNRAAIEAVMPALREQVAVLDRAVAGTGHLVGNAFTLADINLMPILHRLTIPAGRRGSAGCREAPQRVLRAACRAAKLHPHRTAGRRTASDQLN